MLLLSLAAPSLAFGQPASAPAKPGTPPAPATAVPPPPPPPEVPAPPRPAPLSESLTGAARTDYESAKVLFGDGDNAGALVKFKSAYEKSKDPRLLWNVAACEKNLRHYSRALKLVRQYASEGGATLTDQDRSEAQELIKVMDPLTAKLKLTVSEPGAEVFIDDEPIGTTPIEAVVVDIGSRKIRVKKDEFEEYVHEVPVGGSAEVSLEVKLAKIVHEGRLNVRTRTDATISLDGKVVGTGTWSGTLPSGGHSLSISAPKMRPYQSEIYVQDKESRDVNATLEQEPSRDLPTWAWIAGGAVLLGGATTAGFFIFRSDGKYEGPPGNLQPGIVQASTPIRF